MLQRRPIHAHHLRCSTGLPPRSSYALIEEARGVEWVEENRAARRDTMPSRGPASVFGRDPELEDVLKDLEERLRTIEHTRARSYDDELAVIEVLAAPYALAFLHEIRRLDRLCVKQRSVVQSADTADHESQSRRSI